MAASHHLSNAPQPSRSIERLIQRLRQNGRSHSPFSSQNDGEGDGGGAAGVRRRGHPAAGDQDVQAQGAAAAVLVCIFGDGLAELRVILTKRSSNLSTHSGEASLPGGKAEEGDVDLDDSHTATREAKEEIGLDPSLVTILTLLEPSFFKHVLGVVPVIGILHDNKAFKPLANTAGVETIFDVPLEMFLKDENRRWEEQEWMGMKNIVYYFNFETKNKKFVIWGLTAGILIRAASVVYQRPPCFPEQNYSVQDSQISLRRNLIAGEPSQ